MASPLDLPLEWLGKQAPPDVHMSPEDLHTVADLARRLQLEESRRKGQFGVDTRPYTELPETQRTAMMTGVARVVQALQMLGWIDSP